MNLFGVPSTNKGGLSSRRPQVAHPVHDPVRGHKVAFLILDKNCDGGLSVEYLCQDNLADYRD
jgi:hypothetical protein